MLTKAKDGDFELGLLAGADLETGATVRDQMFQKEFGPVRL